LTTFIGRAIIDFIQLEIEMNKVRLVVILQVLCMLLGCAPKSCASNTSQIFKTQWSNNFPGIIKGFSRHITYFSPTASAIHNFCKKQIMDCLDTKNLSIQADLSYSFHPMGYPTYVLTSKNASNTDRFFCEQAMWDTGPYMAPFCTPIDARIEFIAPKNKRSKAKGRKEILPSIHLIPLSASEFFPNAVTAAELKESKNLHLLRKSMLASPELMHYRKEWLDFIESHCYQNLSRDELLDAATTIVSKYDALFQ
jgi:hypothetical protein